MRYCEQTSLAMTHLSMKIGRFICDSTVEVSNARIFGSSSRGFRCNGGYDNEEEDDDEDDDDDVMHGTMTHSSSDLRGFFCRRRRSRRFDDDDEAEPEVDDREPEVDDRSGSDVIPPWRDYDYDRTLRPYRNDRILSLLSRVVRSMDFTSGSPPEVDEGEGDGGGGSEPEETRPLPWRSTEAMSAVEDSSKYLREETAPAVQDNDDDDNNQNSHSQSLSSLSGSSSFRNIPSPDGCYDPPAPRPDPLSGAGGGLSLRLQWLTEAESRHSEPFCPAHHRPSSPPEPRSITGHHHRIPPQPHDPHPHHPGRRHRTRDPQSQSQSQSQSGSSYATPYSFPSVLGEEGGEEEWEEGAGSQNRRDQVLRWLMANDLEVTAQLDEEADDRMTDVVCSGGGPSIIASGWSRPCIVRDDYCDE